MPQDVSLALRGIRWTPRGFSFWMAQAPIFLVVFATFALAARKHWIALAILVTCAWVYGRILRHQYVMSVLDELLSRAVLAVESRRPTRAPSVSAAPDEALPADIPEEAPDEPAPARRAPRRVRTLDVSPAKRLLQLEELRESGLVSAAEYQDKRQEILRAI